MAKRPITPGQKAARARDRERFAAKLATNDALADRAHARLLAGEVLRRRGDDGTYAFRSGDDVSPAIVAILLYRKTAKLDGNAVVACPADDPTADDVDTSLGQS